MLVWNAHKVKIHSLAFSPDGTRIATTAGESRFVWLWEAVTGKLIHKHRSNQPQTRAVEFFPDGTHLAAHSEYSEIQIWDNDTEEVVANLRADGNYSDSLAISPDGSRLFACDYTGIMGWDEPTRHTPLTKRREADRSMTFDHHSPVKIGYSPRGTFLCVAEWNLHLLSPSGVDVRHRFQDPDSGRAASATAFAFTPDESALVVALGHRAAVWKLKEGGKPDGQAVQLKGHSQTVKAVGFLPGNQSVLTAGLDGTARIWDANTGAEIRSFDWGIGKVRVAAVSPDGTLCAAGSDDGRIVVWDVDS